MAEIKVWGGTHPDEKAALAVVDSLFERPIPHVTPGIANQRARELGRRFVDVNLVGAFPGDSAAQEYERCRAVEVLAESEGYDAVIDLHNINAYGENTACIDQNRGVNRRVLGFLAQLGIGHLIKTDYDGVQKYVPNTFVLETLASGLGRDIEKLRDAFDGLANDPGLPEAATDDFQWFRHLGSPHISKVSPDIIGPGLRRRLQGFDILPEEIAVALGYPDREVCLMAWRDVPNPYGYWGELCEPIAVLEAPDCN